VRKSIFSGFTLTTAILTILLLRAVSSHASAAPPEKPVPPQASGTTISYNFDMETPGGMPAKFHAARTGQGSEGKWVVMADPTAPSKPNVVAQTSTDKTDYRFPLLISDEGSFKNLELSVKFKAVAGESTGPRAWYSACKTPITTISSAQMLWRITTGCTMSLRGAGRNLRVRTSRSLPESGTNSKSSASATKSSATSTAKRRS
jgi:hypothetical protein